MGFLRGRLARRVSRLEFTAALAAIAVLIAVFLFKVLALMVDAERTAFSLQVTNLRVALMLEVASRLTRGGHDSIAALKGSNPIALIADQPGNYLGELDAPNPSVIAGGQWYFDKTQQMLVYRVKNKSYFRTALSGPERARFAIGIGFHDVDEDGDYDPGRDRAYSAVLEPSETYYWVNP